MKMKDDEAKRVVTSDEDKMNRQNGEVVPACSIMDDVSSSLSHAAQVNANGKSRSKPTRKRLSTSSPEEDIIDGFAISSFTSLEALESKGHAKPGIIADGRPSNSKIGKCNLENGVSNKKRRAEKRRARMQDPKLKDSDSEDEKQKIEGKERQRERKAAKTDGNHSDSGGSVDGGYICDGESDDDRPSDSERPSATKKFPSQATSVFNVNDILSGTNESTTNDVKDSERAISKSSDWPSSAAGIVPRLGSQTSVTSSSSLPRPLSSTSTIASHSIASSFGHSHPSTLFPHFPSFHSPSGPLPFSHAPGDSAFPYPRQFRGKENVAPYVIGSGQELLRQELNTHFLRTHSDRTHYNLHYENHQHLHNHQHQHQHSHQHQHFHSPPGVPVVPASPLLVPGTPAMPHHGVPPSPHSSGAAAPIPPPLIHRKHGRWCAAHVQIAWQIYYHQQKVQAEMHNDPHVKPEQIPVSRAGNVLSLHSRQGIHDIGYRSPHGGAQGTVSPIAVQPHPGEPRQRVGAFFSYAPVTPTPTNSDMRAVSPYGRQMVHGRSNGMLGLGNTSSLSGSSSYRDAVGRSSLSSSGFGSYGGLGSLPRDWDRHHGSSSSLPWLNQDVFERNREKEREREREREKERERERERDREKSRERENDFDKLKDKEREPNISRLDFEGEKTKESDKQLERSRSPTRLHRPTSFHIASLTGENKGETSAGVVESRHGSRDRRDEDKTNPIEERDIVMLNDKRGTPPGPHFHSGSAAVPYVDKRLYETERPLEPFDLGRYGRPPLSRGPCLQFALPQPPMFSPSSSFPYLHGSAMAAVTHPHFLPHGTRGMMGPHFGPLGPRSRSPLDGPEVIPAENRP